MNWAARSAWLYESDTPDYDQIAAHKIEVVYIDPRSSNAAAVIADLRAHSITPGVYTVPTWEPTLDAAAFARWTSDQLNRLIPRYADTPPYMADLEGVSVDWQTEFLMMYRAHQPERPSCATVAPFQGDLVATVQLNGHGFHLYPQLYYGDMAPADPAGVLLEMARQGFPAGKLHPMYDGATLPADARDGCVFTLERLP